MVICNCVVQAGQIPADTEAALRSGLDAIARQALGGPAQFNWVTVPERSGFTAGAPSTSSVVSMRASEPLEQSVRETLLHELCHFWAGETGCSLEEIVGVITDPQTI